MAQWGNGTDLTGPIAVEGEAEFPTDGLYDAAIKHHIEFTFANGVKLISVTTRDGAKCGAHFEGSEGRIYVESANVVAEPKSIETSVIGPNEIRLYNSPNHERNFIDCVKSRRPTAAPVEVAHRSASICHLGTIATLLGRKLEWDPERERFIGDADANRMLARAMRSPWHI